MPDKKYFLGLGGSFLLGAAVIIVSLVLAWLLTPYLLPIFTGIFPYIMEAILIIFIFIIILVAVYICTFLGVLIKYLFKPMEVSKKAKGYSIAKVKEAGLREKGKTKRQKKVKKKER